MINLGKTYAKLMIFPKMFCKSGPLLNKSLSAYHVQLHKTQSRYKLACTR